MSDYKIHPAAAMFPMMPEDELKATAADIAANGLQEKIVMCKGEVLDGRNRLRACEIAGVSPKFREFGDLPSDDGLTPEVFVVSHNLRRRHLSPSQHSTIAALLEERFKAAAKERQRSSGGDRKSAEAKSVPANLPEPILRREAREEAAALFGVSPRSVQDAKYAITNGPPEMKDKLLAGEITVHKARKIVEVNGTKCFEEPAVVVEKPPQKGVRNREVSGYGRKAVLAAIEGLSKALKIVGLYQQCSIHIERISKELDDASYIKSKE
jgi:hypothetical protein